MEKLAVASIILLWRSLGWAEKRNVFNRLHDSMEKKPDTERRRFYTRNIGSIVTAYKAGDVSFEDAVSLLGALRRKKKRKKRRKEIKKKRK